MVHVIIIFLIFYRKDNVKSLALSINLSKIFKICINNGFSFQSLQFIVIFDADYLSTLPLKMICLFQHLRLHLKF